MLGKGKCPDHSRVDVNMNIVWTEIPYIKRNRIECLEPKIRYVQIKHHRKNISELKDITIEIMHTDIFSFGEIWDGTKNSNNSVIRVPGRRWTGIE